MLVPFILKVLRPYLGRGNRRGCKVALGERETKSAMKEDLAWGCRAKKKEAGVGWGCNSAPVLTALTSRFLLTVEQMQCGASPAGRKEVT